MLTRTQRKLADKLFQRIVCREKPILFGDTYYRFETRGTRQNPYYFTHYAEPDENMNYPGQDKEHGACCSPVFMDHKQEFYYDFYLQKTGNKPQ